MANGPGAVPYSGELPNLSAYAPRSSGDAAGTPLEAHIYAHLEVPLPTVANEATNLFDAKFAIGYRVVPVLLQGNSPQQLVVATDSRDLELEQVMRLKLGGDSNFEFEIKSVSSDALTRALTAIYGYNVWEDIKLPASESGRTAAVV